MSRNRDNGKRTLNLDRFGTGSRSRRRRGVVSVFFTTKLDPSDHFLHPWVGFAVFCGYAAVLLVGAAVLLVKPRRLNISARLGAAARRRLERHLPTANGRRIDRRHAHAKIRSELTAARIGVLTPSYAIDPTTVMLTRLPVLTQVDRRRRVVGWLCRFVPR